ncbi:uncharacterized protein LOC106072788 isoform X4 [Biomphalaria glabrata]|nr:uncharacterized protein LOC106072788 isoform X4 [Biomphalaria glabrata]
MCGHKSVIKQLPWLPDKCVGSMFFDPTLTWLLLVTETTQEIFVIPALSIVDPKAAVNQMFKTDDVTHIPFHNANGNITYGLWWQTLESKQVAVLATNVGEIIFVDLLSEITLTKVTIDVTVTELSLSQDDLQMNTTLLITTITGNQWKLLLETRATMNNFSPDSELCELGYETIDNHSVPPSTLLDPAEYNSAMFSPSRYQHFQPPTFLQPQFARGRHFITAHSTSSSTLKVLDPADENTPHFVYKLPPGTRRAIFTDKLIFTVTSAEARTKKLMILSNQKSEKSLDNNQAFNKEALVQEFDLIEGENLLGVERKRYPFYLHEHRESEWSKHLESGQLIQPMKNKDLYLDKEVLRLPITTHTVLDGCVLVTSYAVYEVRPCISPERLFLHMAMSLPETTCAENLAISIGLDLTSLSELAAETMLQQSCFGRAMKLYTLSKKHPKCPATKRTGGLARHGCISETLVHLRQVLSSSTFELNTWEIKFLSNMLLHCFVYQLHCPSQNVSSIQAALGDFLLGSFSFVEQTALNLLSDYGEIDLLMCLAKARGLVIDALTCLVKFETSPNVPLSALRDLVQRGFSAHLFQSGCLLPYLSAEDLFQLLTIKPHLAIQNIALLKPIVPVLKQNHLLQLAKIFDPSKSVIRGMLLQLQLRRRRTNSLTSVASLTSDTLEMDPKEIQPDVLVDFFLFIVLYLNLLRRKTSSTNLTTLDLNSIVINPADELENMEKEHIPVETHKKLSIQPQPIACGPKHCAVIRNGDVYTCGKSQGGRLGVGDIPQNACPPVRVENLHTLQLKVDAVACGCEHTLALTQQGVYGWGNSKYGQVGVGTSHIYKRPMLLETLQSDTVVAIDCGQYHSLALTADHQIYTWGWGVHGQLGHGNPEDCLIPKHVTYLLNLAVVQIAGGYAHSLVLTESMRVDELYTNAMGDVWSFGCGYFGQLGLGMNNKTTYPQKVLLPTAVTAIGTKFFHCIAVTVTNKIYTWGLHPQNLRQIASSIRSARLAGSNDQDQNAFMFPSLVDSTYVHGQITKVCCGSLHSVLLTEDGSVYLWGRNLEGQLGTGSRQDERIPKMVTSINDQQIVAIASGGEFTLAFSSDGCIWAWGKNDSGQLGFIKTRKENPGPMTLSNNYRRASGNSTEANLPAIFRGLPPPDASHFHWVTMLSTLTQHILWEDPSETEHETTWDNLPSLDKLGKDIYDNAVIPVTLKVLENFCDTNLCLQHSVDVEDWLIAGHISELNADYVQALHYRLKLVFTVKDNMDPVAVVVLCAQLVKHHINLIVDKINSKITLSFMLQQVSFQALYFWQECKLPIFYLEDIFRDHMTSFASSLLDVILRCSYFQLKDINFSSHFSLQVFKTSLKTCVKASDSTRQNKDQITAMVEQYIAEQLQSSLQLQARNKLTSKEQLWTGILRNMKKETGAITLTHTQLDHLVDTGDHSEAFQSTSNSVLFTCGHHYSKKRFATDGVGWLVSEIISSPVSLPYSATLIKHILNECQIKPSSCPRCVLQGLHVP